MLSVASGALYGLLKPANVTPVDAGLAFGVGFMALACGVASPALRPTPPPWRVTPGSNLQDLVVHTLFGVTVALVADRVGRRLTARRRLARSRTYNARTRPAL